jgi:hypothetical protein
VKVHAISVAAVLVVAAGCARSERPILEQFFGASRLRDLTALQPVASVVFEPRQDGIVRSFEITAVTPERVQQTTAVKEVTVEARVVAPGGETVQKVLVLAMERPIDAGAGWRVTAFRAVAASPPPRPR